MISNKHHNVHPYVISFGCPGEMTAGGLHNAAMAVHKNKRIMDGLRGPSLDPTWVGHTGYRGCSLLPQFAHTQVARPETQMKLPATKNYRNSETVPRPDRLLYPSSATLMWPRWL